MAKGFYCKLALTNLGKNRKFYFPYMLSCILMVMLHFVLCSLTYTDTWESIPSSGLLYSILTLGCCVVEIFALILLFYTNGFLMKRRKREFGLYNVLGMEKRHIGRVLFWETLFAFTASILIGLGLGMLMSKLNDGRRAAFPFYWVTSSRISSTLPLHPGSRGRRVMRQTVHFLARIRSRRCCGREEGL